MMLKVVSTSVSVSLSLINPKPQTDRSLWIQWTYHAVLVYSVLRGSGYMLRCEMVTTINLVEHPSPHRVILSFPVMRTFKIYSLNSFQIDNTVLSTTVTTMPTLGLILINLLIFTSLVRNLTTLPTAHLHIYLMLVYTYNHFKIAYPFLYEKQIDEQKPSIFKWFSYDFSLKSIQGKFCLPELLRLPYFLLLPGKCYDS